MTNSALSAKSFYADVEKIPQQFKLVNEANPETYLAAETVRSLFEQLIENGVSFDNSVRWQSMSSLMLFGAFESWVMSYILTSSGYHDISLMCMRRSIEYTCYLTKIHGSDERATLWVEKFDNPDSRREFNSKFAIPRAYLTDRHVHLRPLIVLYDYTSDFGTHGNFEALVAKFRDEPEHHRRIFSLQYVDPDIAVSLGVVLVVGYRMLQAILHVLRPQLAKPVEIETQLRTLSVMIRAARHKAARADFKGRVPDELLESIDSDDQATVNELFQKIVEKYPNP